MSTGLSLTALVVATILIVSAVSIQDAFASNGDGPKEKHIEKHEEKHGEKHEEKHGDKHEEKHEEKTKHKEKLEKIKEKIKEKIIPKIKEKLEKIKDKIADYKDKKSKTSQDNEKNSEDSDSSTNNDDLETSDSSNDDVIISDTSSNDEEDFSANETYNEEDVFVLEDGAPRSKMNKFKGSGDDYAPTLGSDRYGNNYVDNGFTLNDFVTDVENFKTHMPLQTLQVGESNTAVLKIYDNRGASKIEHVELVFGIDYDEYASQSENRIIWTQNFKGEQSVMENDPDNLLMDVNAVGKADGKIMEITVDFAFRAPMDESKIGLVVWDQERHSRTVYFNDGIKVVGESLNPPEVVTILDDNGYPVKITMTGDHEGIDEEGNIWTHNSPWKRQSIGVEKPSEPELVGNHGFDRNHGMFESYKNTQAQTAQEKLNEILGGRSIYNFSD